MGTLLVLNGSIGTLANMSVPLLSLVFSDISGIEDRSLPSLFSWSWAEVGSAKMSIPLPHLEPLCPGSRIQCTLDQCAHPAEVLNFLCHHLSHYYCSTESLSSSTSTFSKKKRDVIIPPLSKNSARSGTGSLNIPVRVRHRTYSTGTEWIFCSFVDVQLRAIVLYRTVRYCIYGRHTYSTSKHRTSIGYRTEELYCTVQPDRHYLRPTGIGT